MSATPRSPHGAALVLTLAMVALLTLLVIAFVSSVRIERNVGANYNDAVRLRQAADSALSEAVAVLAAATPPLRGDAAWVIAPGFAFQVRGGQVTTNRLYNVTNDPPTTLRDWALTQNNLNRGGRICGVNAFYPLPANQYPLLTNATTWGGIAPTGSAIWAGWTTLGTNGTGDGLGVTTNIVGTTTNIIVNPVVVRYSWWVDADSCKVDLNAAGWRSTTDTNRSQPGDVDLRGLEPPFYDSTNALTAVLVSAYRPWATPESYRLAFGTPSASGWSSNQFYLTVNSRDTGTDAFGRARWLLSSLTMADTNNSPFTDDRWATGLYSNIVTDTARNTLAKKYGRFGTAQILANIIDYQRPAGAMPTHDTPLDPQALPATYCGLKKGPLIENVIVHVATNSVDTGGGTNQLIVHTFVDLKLVNGYSLDRGLGWWAKVNPLSIALEYTIGGSSGVLTTTPGEQSVALTASVPANSFRLLSQVAALPPDFQTNVVGVGAVPALTKATVVLQTVRLLMSNDNEYVCDWMAPSDFSACYPVGLVFSGGNIIPYTTPGNAVGNSPKFNGNPPATHTMPLALGKHDPRVRTFANGPTPPLTANWFAIATTNVNPTSTDSYSSRLAPEQYNLLANVRAIPNGSFAPSHAYLIDDIAEAPFQSVGELGSIHTGYPWRTLRLRSVRPETGSNNTAWVDTPLGGNHRGIGDPNTGLESVEQTALPDWVVLDMFAVTNGPATGRLNINQYFDGPSAGLAARIPPLRCLFYNSVAGLTGSVATTIASNIAKAVFVTGSPYRLNPAFLTPGEICEIQGLGYSSNSNHPSTADRELPIRRIANLITTRAERFTIWLTVQTVMDRDRDGRFDWTYRIRTYSSPADLDATWFINTTSSLPVVDKELDGDGDGDMMVDLITGQLSVQGIAERIADPGPDGVWGTGDDTARVRLLYVRYLPD